LCRFTGRSPLRFWAKSRTRIPAARDFTHHFALVTPVTLPGDQTAHPAFPAHFPLPKPSPRGLAAGFGVMSVTKNRDFPYWQPSRFCVELKVAGMSVSSMAACGTQAFTPGDITWVISPIRVWEKAHLKVPLTPMNFATDMLIATNLFHSSHLWKH
jgi:hypothetical protein